MDSFLAESFPLCKLKVRYCFARGYPTRISKVLSDTVSGIGETTLGNNGEKQDLAGNKRETGSRRGTMMSFRESGRGVILKTCETQSGPVRQKCQPCQSSMEGQL